MGIQFTEQELQELQKINTVTDQELGKRVVTPQEIEVFNSTVLELFEQGFAVTKENFLKLWTAFDSNPQVPITKPNILETVKVYRNQYDWKSPQQMEFDKLSATLGPEKTALVNKLLSGNGLLAPPQDGGIENFVQLVRHSQAQGWGLENAVVFYRLINHFKSSVPNTHLYRKPNPDELRRQKERESQAAKDAAWRKEYNDFHDTRRNDPEFLKAEAEKERLAAVQAYNERWHGRVTDFINSIPSNVDRAEAESLFSTPQGQGGWHQTFINLDEWYQRTKMRRAMAGRMG